MRDKCVNERQLLFRHGVPPLLSGFVCVFHPAASGSSPQHPIYTSPFIQFKLYVCHLHWNVNKKMPDWPIFKIKNHCSATHHHPPQIIFKPVHFSFTSREALILETSCSTCSNAHSKYSECSLALDNPFNCSSFYSLSTK